MDRSSFRDAPFHCPPDIVVDLPPPLSVNRTRRVDWSAKGSVAAWIAAADCMVIMAKRRAHNPLKFNRTGRFELTITLSETQSRLDLDNGIKMLIDYLRRIELIEDDAPKNMRRFVVEWGDAPLGTRVTIRPLAAP